MEGNRSVKHIKNVKPPSEPPPSREQTYSHEEKQWVDDVVHKSTQELTKEIESKVCTIYQTAHPQPLKYRIPTPKSTSNSYAMSNWSENETIKWKQNNENMWKPAHEDPHILAYEGPMEDNYDDIIANKWDELVGNKSSNIS